MYRLSCIQLDLRFISSTINTIIKVLALTRFDRNGASSRMRTIQYQPLLRNLGIDLTIQSFIDKDGLASRYLSGRYSIRKLASRILTRVKTVVMDRPAYDLVWIEKEVIPWLPYLAEKAILCGASYVLDYDDATFHNYDLHPRTWIRGLYGRKLDTLMANATLVVAGNSYLADRARNASAGWVEIVPTVVDYAHYANRNRQSIRSNSPGGAFRRKTIVWIGTPYTVKYLLDLKEDFQRLSTRIAFTLRVIGGGRVEMPGVDIECLEWKESNEVERLSECDIGIMPLRNTPWEKGKCGYKLIQYMACSLPVVASAIGVNLEIVRHGENGLLVGDEDSWVEQLERLLRDDDLRREMGHLGQKSVEEKYSLERMSRRLANLLTAAASGNHKKV